jgi:uncharacterized protein
MIYRIIAGTLIFSALFITFSSFQALTDETAVDHMRQLSEKEEMLSTKYLSYMSEIAHGNRARKMEKRRQELLTSVREAIQSAGKLRPYKGDASLRDAYKKYWSVLLSVFNEDYSKIVDMEEVAERSYDAMEAYLLIQEKAGETVDAAYKDVATAYRAFADKHGVKLLEAQQTKLTSKLNEAGQVNQYLNQVYLIFFKSYVQEGVALQGLNSGDLNAVEQAKNSMAKYAAEGLSKLDTVQAFKGDASVKNACRKVLEFHKMEADKFSVLSGYLIKHEEFDKMKKSFESIPASRRTKQDAENFNKAVKEINEFVNENNKMNEELNTSRSKVLDGWNDARKKFMDVHVPHK